MKLSYRTATISYCPDLTDPQATSWPIAMVAVGRVNGSSDFMAATVGIDAKRLGLDPLAAALLADVPHMIRRHIDAAMKELGATATPDTVLDALRESLKTSIHVSDISASSEMSLAEARKVRPAWFEELEGDLEAQLKRPRPTPPDAWRPTVPPQKLLEPAPEQLFWVPRPRPSAPAILAG